METGVDAVDLNGHVLGDWVWCLHCERCYQVGEYRLEGGLQLCPYPGCDGDTVLDARAWNGEYVMGFRQREDSFLPDIPVRDKKYAIY